MHHRSPRKHQALQWHLLRPLLYIKDLFQDLPCESKGRVSRQKLFFSRSSDTFSPVLGRACTLLLLRISRLTRFSVLKSPYSVSRAYNYTACGAGAILVTKVVLGKVWKVNGWNEVMSCPPGFNSVRFAVNPQVESRNLSSRSRSFLTVKMVV